MEGDESLELEHPRRLHVESTAAVENTVPDLGGEGIDAPMALVRGDDVGVVEQHQRRLVASFQAGPKVASSRRGLRGLIRDTLRFEKPPEELHRAALVSRGVGRIDAQVLLKASNRLVLKRFRLREPWYGNESEENRKDVTRSRAHW
jgi:hypothetical protein